MLRLKKEKSDKNLIGIALGGGGVRGAAHIGVLQNLKEAGIKVDVISGVSAGSVIAAMYAFSEDPFWIEKKFRDFWLTNKLLTKNSIKNKPTSFKESFKKRISDYYATIHNVTNKLYLDTEQLEIAIKALLPINNFSELKIPLKVVTTNLNDGKDIVYDKGDLISPLIQSCSIPGVFPPVIHYDKIISDGGVGMPIPISVIKDLCDFSIAIDIGQYKLKSLDFSDANSIAKRAKIITSNRLKHLLSLEADFVIKPDTLGKEWYDFEAWEDLLAQGRKTTDKYIKQLIKLINSKNFDLVH